MQYEIALHDKEIAIQIKDQLIYSDTSKFAAVIQKVKESTVDSCAVQLTGLTHIDSSGLRMLLLLHDACKEKNASLRIAGSQGQVKEMLLHCRFDTIVRMDD